MSGLVIPQRSSLNHQDSSELDAHAGNANSSPYGNLAAPNEMNERSKLVHHSYEASMDGKPNLTYSTRFNKSLEETCFTNLSTFSGGESVYTTQRETGIQKALYRMNLNGVYDYRNAIKIGIFSLLGIMAAFMYIVPPDGEIEKVMYSIASDSHQILEVTDELDGYLRCDFTIVSYGQEIDRDLINVTGLALLHITICRTHDIESCDDVELFELPQPDDRHRKVAEVQWSAPVPDDQSEAAEIYIVMWTTGTSESTPILLGYEAVSNFARFQLPVAALILVLLYTLIISEIIHRTVAAMLASTLALAALSLMNKGPTLEEVISWIEWETLMLLFGMMILVAIFAESGFFDYISLLAYRFV